MYIAVNTFCCGRMLCFISSIVVATFRSLEVNTAKSKVYKRF